MVLQVRAVAVESVSFPPQGALTTYDTKLIGVAYDEIIRIAIATQMAPRRNTYSATLTT